MLRLGYCGDADGLSKRKTWRIIAASPITPCLAPATLARSIAAPLIATLPAWAGRSSAG